MQPRLHISRQFDRLRIAEDIHRQPGLIDHHLAVSTVFEMAFDFLLHREFELTVDIVRNLANEAFAIQFVPPCRK